MTVAEPRMGPTPYTEVRTLPKPDCIVSDNGTEFTSTAILKWAGDTGVAWHYIDPGKPQQNPRPLTRTSGVRSLDDRKLQRQPAR